MTRVAFSALIAGLLVYLGGVATAAADKLEPRIALVIANQGYTQPGAALANTYADGNLVKSALERVGFHVTPVQDTRNEGELLRAIADHIARIKAAGPGAVGFVYYSGHGAADGPDGTNFLIPTQAPIVDVSDLPLMAVRLDRITEALASSGRIHFVVFDACRDVPLKSDGKSYAFKGFAPIREHDEMLIAFATAPRQTALDQGIYARVLAAEIVKPGAESNDVFLAVRQQVSHETRKSRVPQRPEFLNRLGARFYFSPPPNVEWDKLKFSVDVTALSGFAKRFPGVPWGDLAETRIAVIEKKVADDRIAKVKAQQDADRRKQEEESDREEKRVTAAEADHQRLLAQDDVKRQLKERLAAEAEELARVVAMNADARKQELAMIEANKRHASAADEARKSEIEARRRAAEQLASSERQALDAKAAESVLIKDIQIELKRAGCYGGEPDGKWGTVSADALARFAKETGMKPLPASITPEMLTSLRVKPGRVCPLTCDADEQIVKGKCVQRIPEKKIVTTQPTPHKSQGDSRITVSCDGRTEYGVQAGALCRRSDGAICIIEKGYAGIRMFGNCKK